MTLLKNLLFSSTGLFFSTPVCYAIAGPDTKLADQAGLPAFTTLTADDGTGLIDQSLALAIWLFAFVAIAFLIIAGYKYLTAGGDEEQIKKAKGSVIYSIVGMVIVTLSYAIVNVFKKLQTSPSPDTPFSTEPFTTEAKNFINTLLSGLMYVTAPIAVLLIIVGAYMFLTAAGDEEKIKKGKASIGYSIVGLVVIILSRTIVRIFFAEGGPADLGGRQVDLSGAKGLINSIVNFATGFVGGLAILMLIYAGFLWITAQGEDDQIGKAKKIILYAILGLIIIIFSYSIVTIVVAPSASSNSAFGNFFDTAMNFIGL
ncbi:MAG: hypothetical protein PHU71_00535 [Candidatus Gracilibacteria bacterium]|nr:hypothetical protein [Candidatus Gracilibacteria bacterium]